MGLLSGKRPARLGIEGGRLLPVSERYWNAVSSTASGDYHRIAPIAGGRDPARRFAALKAVVARHPGATIVTADGAYLYAECSTPLLGFVDDVEFLLVPDEGVIHVRSQSRLGRKDFGVNRKRIEAIRSELDLSDPA